MINIIATYKRYNLDGQWHSLLLQELMIQDHARQTRVCNMVSAVSLYGIEALQQKHHWHIVNRSGLLIVKNIYPDGSSSMNDDAVMRTILIQLRNLSIKFPNEIKFVVLTIPPLDFEVDGADTSTEKYTEKKSQEKPEKPE